MFSPPVSNRFCDDWSQAFLNAAERCNPFLLRQILENFKLKVRKHSKRQTLIVCFASGSWFQFPKTHYPSIKFSREHILYFVCTFWD